jgi:hypothetical protein
MKNKKSAGIDGIPADLNVTADAFLPLFSDIWTSETIPDEWRRGVIVKIPKKGNLSICKKLEEQIFASKVFCKVILFKIIEFLKKGIRMEKAGFRPGRSCVDQINTLRMIIEQSDEINAQLCMLFVDFHVAFDSLKRECIWRYLRNRGLPEKIVNIIK